MPDSRPEVLDPATRTLVSLAAAIAQGEEPAIRDRVNEAIEVGVSDVWVDELLLQSVLMVGWPRTLVAAALWRKAIGRPATGDAADFDTAHHAEWLSKGEATCRVVYGDNYAKLRENVAGLHPALDIWMVTDGYGRVLSRPGLDLKRRELCTVVQTAILDTPRQLHSHLRGALHAGATIEEVDVTLTTVNQSLPHDHWKAVKELWEQVRESWSPLA